MVVMTFMIRTLEFEEESYPHLLHVSASTGGIAPIASILALIVWYAPW